MSDVYNHVEQYAGDEALYCHIGKHMYTNGTCAWCNRQDHKAAPEGEQHAI